MKKLLLILLVLSQTIFADHINVINKMSDIPKNKDVLLVFSMKYCPYCSRQESDILRNIKPKYKNIEFLKVMRNSYAFNELMKTGNFEDIKYYPTTAILKIDNENHVDVKYEFWGQRDSSEIIDILNDKEIMLGLDSDD